VPKEGQPDTYPSRSTNPAAHGHESTLQPVDDKSDALTITIPSKLKSTLKYGQEVGEHSKLSQLGLRQIYGYKCLLGVFIVQTPLDCRYYYYCICYFYHHIKFTCKTSDRIMNYEW